MTMKRSNNKKVIKTGLKVAVFVGAGYLIYRTGKKAGIKVSNEKQFAEGFYKATQIIHDTIIDTTDTVRLKETGEIVGLDGYLRATADGICDRLGDLADNKAIAVLFEER